MKETGQRALAVLKACHRAGKAKAIAPVRPSVTGTDGLRTSLVRFPGQAATLRSKAFLRLPYQFPASQLGKPPWLKLTNDKGLLHDHPRSDDSAIRPISI